TLHWVAKPSIESSCSASHHSSVPAFWFSTETALGAALTRSDSAERSTAMAPEPAAAPFRNPRRLTLQRRGAVPSFSISPPPPPPPDPRRLPDSSEGTDSPTPRTTLSGRFAGQNRPFGPSLTTLRETGRASRYFRRDPTSDCRSLTCCCQWLTHL